jgi:hypothetical protein
LVGTYTYREGGRYVYQKRLKIGVCEGDFREGDL